MIKQSLCILFTCYCGLVSATGKQYFRIINNYNQSLTYQLHTERGSVSPNNGEVAAQQASTSLKASTNWLGSKGYVQISLNNNDAVNTCRINYHGSLTGHSLTWQLDKNSQHNKLCQRISLINPSHERYGAGLGTMDSGSDAAHALCQGHSNCLIINPDFDWARKALSLQSEIGLDKPLNQLQFVSTHNSYISNAYHGTYPTDPNQYLTLTQQLNDGVRALELDVHWVHLANKFLLCHAHPKHEKSPAWGCNAAMDHAAIKGLTEIKTWLQQALNKGQKPLLQLYFDESLAGHLPELEALLDKTIGPYVYTRDLLQADAKANGWQLTDADELPVNKITPNDIFKHDKYILIMTHDRDTVANSNVYFTAGQNSTELPHDAGSKHFSAYPQCSALEPQDPEHLSLWRANGDRTFISKHFGNGNDFIEINTIRDLSQCGDKQSTKRLVNMFSVDRLGTKDHGLNDPRLFALVWSFAPGYPKQASADDQYVYDPDLLGIKNIPASTPIMSVLCTHADDINPWYIAVRNNIKESALQACQRIDRAGQFAMPVNSAQMHEVKQMLAGSHEAVLVKIIPQTTARPSLASTL